MKDYIKIESLKKNNKRLNIKFSTSDRLKKFFNTFNFWIEYDFEIEDVDNSILSVPFIANILPIVWLTNSSVLVDEIDFDFYESIKLFKKGYEKMYPQIKFYETNIEYNRIVHNDLKKANVSGMLFSGGVDAYATLYSHLEEKPILITVWGADINTSNTNAWNLMKKMNIDAGLKFDLKNQFIKSNFKEFLNTKELNKLIVSSKDKWWHGFQHGIGIISLTAPLCFKLGIKMLYIASSYSKEDKNITCASYPTIDENIHFCKVNVIHDQFELNRQQKIEKIVKISNAIDKFPQLHVCWENTSGENCCRCEKCCRTMLGLLIENENPKKYGFNNTDGKFIQKRMYFYNNVDKVLIPLWRDMIKKYKNTKATNKFSDELKWLETFDVQKQHYFLKKIFRKIDYIVNRLK